MQSNEHIKLSFPVNAAYVSSARLTASSIANRIRFDLDEIEDIKTAVSEACTFLIKCCTAAASSSFEIRFLPGGDEMTVDITATGKWSEPKMDEMSLMMISALVDKFSISGPEDGQILISMYKKHRALFE